MKNIFSLITIFTQMLTSNFSVGYYSFWTMMLFL